MKGGERCQRLSFQGGPCIPSLVAVSLSIETVGNPVWHGQGRQAEMGRLARVIVVATSGAPEACCFLSLPKGRNRETKWGKWE